MAILEQLTAFSDQRFLSIYEALTEKGYGPLDAEIAKRLKFRPQSIRKIPLEKRARHAHSFLRGPGQAELIYEFLGTYLVKTRRELVTGFLDATGVEHEEGMIEDVDATGPAPEKIGAAVESLDAQFDPEDVTLYLALCVEMWPGCDELGQALEARR